MTAQANDALAHAHAGLVGRDDIQFSLPAYAQPKVPEWLRAMGHFLREYNRPLEWIVWIAGAAILLTVLYYLIRTYAPALVAWRPRPRETPDAALEEWRPTAAEARQLLAEADALAAVGRLWRGRASASAAQHRGYRGAAAPAGAPALTSREIGGLPDLPSAARPAFVGIARAVERSLFAGRGGRRGAIRTRRKAICRLRVPAGLADRSRCGECARQGRTVLTSRVAIGLVVVSALSLLVYLLALRLCARIAQRRNPAARRALEIGDRLCGPALSARQYRQRGGDRPRARPAQHATAS